MIVMKKIINIALSLLLGLSFTSCDLDRYPDLSYPEGESMQTPEEAQQVVFGIYSAFKSGALYSGALTLAPDLQADLAQAVVGYSNAYGDIYRWITKSTNAEVEGVYSGLYVIVSRANFFLEKVGQLEATLKTKEDIAFVNKCKGDVYFMRAMAYSDLIRLYCNAYDPQTADKELGVSIVTTYSQQDKKPLRSSLKASYEQVLNDLREAEKYVKRNGNSSAYVTIGVVHALYARVYLMMQEWALAAEHASKLIDGGTYRLQSALRGASSGLSEFQHMWRYDEGPEVIWRISMSYTDRGGALGLPFLGSPQMINMEQYQPDYVPANWVLNLYSNNDLRQSVYFQTQQTAYPHNLTCPLLNKYPGNAQIDAEAGRRVLTNQPKIFRLAEMYLIRAEASYHLGKEKQANDDLTTLRQSRIKDYAGREQTGEYLIQEIRDERVRELYMEGFRLSDLKRWGMGFKRQPQKHTVATVNELSIASNNPLFTWPIPKHEMDAVQGMQPNASND